MSNKTRPVERPEKDDLKLIAVKIPRKLIALLDNAASNNWDTRNRVIRHILERHFEKN